LYPICHWFEKKGVAASLAIALSILILVIIFTGIISLLVWQISQVAGELPTIQTKISSTFTDITNYLNENYNISVADQESWMQRMSDQSGNQMLPFLRTTLSNLTLLTVFIVLVPIMSALILYQRTQLFAALQSFVPKIPKEKLRDIMFDTINTYYNFIKGMLIVYLIVGILNSVGLLIIGVPHAILFGFIAAILTFIPYIGIIIGAILPMAVAWITFNSIWYPVGVVLVFTVVQYLEANIIFPWAVSSRLQVNTLSTIIAILAGSILWGSAGMILFIPFLGILKLVADKTEGMQAISLLLGTKEKTTKQVVKK